MAILLGIDTGGTYTDAVLFDEEAGVIASAKALTTKYDLLVGIREAVERILNTYDTRPDIRLVSLSTTLATNAIVEGQGSPICLLLLGYPPDSLDQAGLRQVLGEDAAVFLQGGHGVNGEEQEPLDLEQVRRAILDHAPTVSAFAVSGYFGVRNPGHELAVRDLVRELTQLPVTCGHELTTNLHASRRALTAALNARLIPFLQQLILAVQAMLDEKDVRAPLMVVKGDGSLVDAQIALERPVETILSGPAASVVGASYLSGERDMAVVDMGGTTTDIAMLRDGRPVLNLNGATVGGWRTMVEAVEVHTFGLGGDSEIHLDEGEENGLAVGPNRVVPLCLLGYQYAQIVDVLRRQAANQRITPLAGRFALRQRPLDGERGTLSSHEEKVWRALADGPLPLSVLFGESPKSYFLKSSLDRLVEHGLVVVSAFTPSDVAHVLGYQQDWSLEAARLGADLWYRARLEAGFTQDLDARSACERVMHQVTLQAGRAVVGVALAEAYGVNPDDYAPLRRVTLDKALRSRNGHIEVLDVSLTLHRALVAIGAPVNTYYPHVAERLHTQLNIPPHAAIANAVGAVAGGVMQTVRAIIKPLDDETLRLHLPTGNHDFDKLEDAAAFAGREICQMAEEQARQAGARDVKVSIERQDDVVTSKGFDIYLGSTLTATAAGRPRLAER